MNSDVIKPNATPVQHNKKAPTKTNNLHQDLAQQLGI